MDNFLQRDTDEDKERSVLFKSGFVNISVGLVIESDGKYLLVEEAKHDLKGLWNFPSGKVNSDELILEAAKREVLEETGYNVTLTNLLSIYYYLSSQPSGNDKVERLTVRFNFWAKLIDPDERASFSPEISALAWKTLEELRALSDNRQLRNWITKKMVEDIGTGHRLPLEAVYQVDKR